MSRRRKRQQLAPQTSPSDVQGGGVIWLTPRRAGGIPVNEYSALTSETVFACLKVISEDVSGLPWHVFKRRPDGGKDLDFADTADWLLDVQPNPEMSAFQFRETLLIHALTWGNGYAEIERDGAGRPVWLWPITPDRVEPQRIGNRIVYEVSNYNKASTFLEAEDVFHLRGPGFDGLVGYSPVRLFARIIGEGLSQSEYSAAFLENDATPAGLIKFKRRATDAQIKQFLDTWRARHGGASKGGRIGVLQEDMDWVGMSFNPEDAQLLQSRQWHPVLICRMFRVQPPKIMDHSRSTFGNVEHLDLEHMKYTLIPWIRRLENEANIKLFGRVNRGSKITKMNVASLLRGDATTQASYITQLMAWGILSHDESRAVLDYNPIKDGDTHFVPVNTQPLERALEPPAPPPNGQADVDTVMEDEEPAEEDLSAALRPVVLDAFQRIARRAMHRVEGARKRGADLNGFWGEHAKYAREQLAPPLEALAKLTGRPAPECDGTEGLEALSSEESPDWEGWARARTDGLLKKKDLAFCPTGPGGGVDPSCSPGEGGGKSDSADDPRQEQWDREDAAREEFREKEDEKIQTVRDKEDAVREKQREKVEDQQEKLAGERERMEDRQAREETKFDAANEKEDKALEKSREKEDKEISKAREKEDAAFEKEREKFAEDDEATGERWGDEDDARESARDKEDAAREKERDAERERLKDDEDALEEAEGRWADEDADIDAARNDEDAEIHEARNKERDALLEREREMDRKEQEAEARREKEDEGREAAREKEDEEIAARRQKEFAEMEARWAKEDEELYDREQAVEGRLAELDEQDEAVEARRDKEDEELAARRDIEDMELARAREGGVE